MNEFTIIYEKIYIFLHKNNLLQIRLQYRSVIWYSNRNNKKEVKR